jgi:hypothetical protein
LTDFHSKNVYRWRGLLNQFSNLDANWVFRGQTDDWKLSTSLERICREEEIDFSLLPGIEKQILRDFQRKYEGPDKHLIDKNVLYCLALIQHYRGPTRLQDWTYSPYIATFFAIQSKKENATNTIWCLNSNWIDNYIKKNKIDKIPTPDKDREKLARSLIYNNKRRRKFVYLDSPFHLNTRLNVQQGIFLFSGNITVNFEENFKNMPGWDDEKNVFKIFCRFNLTQRRIALAHLHRMNINPASLFPGLDGFSESLRFRLPHYELMASEKTGGY